MDTSGFGGMAGFVQALVADAQGNPTTDLTPLFNTINAAGAHQKDLINNLPAELQAKYAQYQASLGQAGQTLQGTTNQIGQTLLNQTQANYSPTSPAVQATLAALNQQDYSTLPGTINALKSNLAASGGLDRGGAARAITQATLAPAAAYSGQAATVQGQQLQQQQQNVQNALNKIAQLDDTTAQQLFGMTTAQAQQILTSGRQDLQNHLSQLINQSTTQTNQVLGLQGYQANQAYQNAVADNASGVNLAGSTLNAASTLGGLLPTSSVGGSGLSGAEAVQRGLGTTPSGQNALPSQYGIGY